jgi:hypothetical protein
MNIISLFQLAATLINTSEDRIHLLWVHSLAGIFEHLKDRKTH